MYALVLIISSFLLFGPRTTMIPPVFSSTSYAKLPFSLETVPHFAPFPLQKVSQFTQHWREKWMPQVVVVVP